LQIPAIVLGRGVTALATLRSLGRAGIPAYCISHVDDFAGYSRWARCLPNTLQDTSTVAELAAFLRGLPFERAVLMPCSDWWAQKVARLDPELSERFFYVGSSGAVINCFCDKLECAALAEAHGIPHPKTFAVDSPGDVNALPISRDTSYFIKARDSQAFTMLLGIKAAQVSTVEDARAVVEKAHAVGQQVLLQEYLPGPPTNHYFVDGYADPAGNIHARFVRQRLRMHPWPFGNSTCTRSIEMTEVPDILETVDRLVAASGIRGIFSVEVKRDTRDGIAKVLDVNLRPWWYVEFAAVCGVNVCEMAYRAAIGLPVKQVTSYKVGRTCVFPLYDFGACLRLIGTGEMTPLDWASSWLFSKHTILSFHDPLPYVHCYSVMGLSYLGTRARRMPERLRRRLLGERLGPASVDHST